MASSSQPEKGSAYYTGFQLSPKGKWIFPDFILEFKGQQPGSFYPGSLSHRMGDIFQFEASHGDERVKFNWSSGTGSLGPVVFSMNGKKFELSTFLPAGINEKDPKEQIVKAVHNNQVWFCYPSVPDLQLTLSTPSLFLKDMEGNQKLVPNLSEQFGRFELTVEKPVAQFSIASQGWQNGKPFESTTFRYPLSEAIWKLPVGFYVVGGGSPGFEKTYFEVKPNELVKVLLKVSKDTDPLGRKSRTLRSSKPRVQAKLNSDTVIKKTTVTEFEGGLNLALSKVVDKMISHWICLEVDPETIGSPCTTIPSEKFKNMASVATDDFNFKIVDQAYQVKIISVDANDEIHVRVSKVDSN